MWDMQSYIKAEEERMKKTPMMIMDKKGKWIILESSEENINKFNKLLSETPTGKLEDNITLYYNTLDEIEKVWEGIDLRDELERERQREHDLNEPPIKNSILNITNKEELVLFLINERYSREETLIDEYSNDFELDMVILEAEQNKLNELVDKYIKDVS